MEEDESKFVDPRVYIPKEYNIFWDRRLNPCKKCGRYAYIWELSKIDTKECYTNAWCPVCSPMRSGAESDSNEKRTEEQRVGHEDYEEAIRLWNELNPV